MIRFFFIVAVLFWTVISQSCVTTYRSGAIFEIPLSEDGSGGYRWTYKKEGHGVVLVDSSQMDFMEENGFLGHTMVYRLKGTEKGKYTLEFQKLRSFEKDSILEENRKRIKIRIKN